MNPEIKVLLSGSLRGTDTVEEVISSKTTMQYFQWI